MLYAYNFIFKFIFHDCMTEYSDLGRERVRLGTVSEQE